MRIIWEQGFGLCLAHVNRVKVKIPFRRYKPPASVIQAARFSFQPWSGNIYDLTPPQPGDLIVQPCDGDHIHTALDLCIETEQSLISYFFR